MTEFMLKRKAFLDLDNLTCPFPIRCIQLLNNLHKISEKVLKQSLLTITPLFYAKIAGRVCDRELIKWKAKKAKQVIGFNRLTLTEELNSCIC